ncbi:MAG: hypothetical protein IH957_12290 [Chloroflexi bacterium]|nr:hypothetical protein [Chloroflexota bacterium]
MASARIVSIMNERALVGLAILKANWDRTKRGYLSSLVPFLVHCVGNAEGQVLSLTDAQTCIREQFGLDVPQPVIESIARRGYHEGALERSQGTLRLSERTRDSYDLAKPRAAAERQLQGLVDKFLRFAREELGVEMEAGEAETALLDLVERQCIPLMRAQASGRSVEVTGPEEGDVGYVLGRFIVNVFHHDPEAFAYLETAIKGSMLATYLYLPNPSATEEAFSDLTVLLDTPFLLDALGFGGPAREEAAREALRLLYKLGCTLSCFKHTLRETESVLEGCAGAIAAGRRTTAGSGSVFYYLSNGGFSASDIELMVARLPRSLKSLKVEIVGAPPITPAVSVDEIQLEDLLQAEVHPDNPVALRNDLESLTATHRLRRGGTCSRLETCAAVFATPNVGVVRVARKFFDEASSVAPHAMVMRDLATLAWLKKPGDAPDLPRKQILADAYAALEPANDLWKAYMEEIERLQASGGVTAEDYALLRYSTEAKTALMDETRGLPEAFAPGIVQEVLDRARSEVRADLVKDLGASQAKTAAQRARVREIAETGGRLVSRTLFWAVASILVVAAIAALPFEKPLTDGLSGVLGVIVGVSLFIFAILTIGLVYAWRKNALEWS